MHRNVFRAATVACFSSVAACSLFVSLDDLSDGGSSDASTVDDANDAGISDAPSISDSSIVIADSGDAAACLGFCDDFDDRTTVPGAWESIELSGNGSASDLSISSTEFVSPPHSLHVQIPARPSGGTDISNINKSLPLTAGSMTIDFDMKIVGSQSGFSGFDNALELSLGGNYAGSVTAGGAGNTVADYWVNFTDGGHIQPLFDFGPNDTAWHHIHYAAHYDPTGGSILITRDGTTIANVAGATTFATGAVPSSFTLALGYSTQPTLPAFDVYFDNVQVQ